MRFTPDGITLFEETVNDQIGAIKSKIRNLDKSSRQSQEEHHNQNGGF